MTQFFDERTLQRCVDGVLAQYRRFSASGDVPVIIDFAMIRDLPAPPGMVGGGMPH